MLTQEQGYARLLSLRKKTEKGGKRNTRGTIGTLVSRVRTISRFCP